MIEAAKSSPSPSPAASASRQRHEPPRSRPDVLNIGTALQAENPYGDFDEIAATVVCMIFAAASGRSPPRSPRAARNPTTGITTIMVPASTRSPSWSSA